MPYNAICQNSLTVPKIRKENSLALFRRDASLGRTCLPLSLMDLLKTPFCERCWNDFQTMQPCSAVIELEIELPATEVWRRDLRHVIFFIEKRNQNFKESQLDSNRTGRFLKGLLIYRNTRRSRKNTRFSIGEHREMYGTFPYLHALKMLATSPELRSFFFILYQMRRQNLQYNCTTQAVPVLFQYCCLLPCVMN